MPKQEVPFVQLRSFLPEGCFEPVMLYLQQYRVHLTVTRQRQSILGDYRHAHEGKPHRISVNSNLNPYSFLITLLHELAHLLTYERYGHRVPAHGKEWKHQFSMILDQFLQQRVFPADIEKALLRSIQNPAASSCGDEHLMRVLRVYDRPSANQVLVEQVPEGKPFKISGDRLFLRGPQQRKRIRCQEIATGKWYLFSPVYEVTQLTE